MTNRMTNDDDPFTEHEKRAIVEMMVDAMVALGPEVSPLGLVVIHPDRGFVVLVPHDMPRDALPDRDEWMNCFPGTDENCRVSVAVKDRR